MSSRYANDIDGVHAANLGENIRKEVGADGTVSVKSIIKAWNTMAEKGFHVSKEVREGRVLSVKKRDGKPASPVKKEGSSPVAAKAGEQPQQQDDAELEDLDLEDMDLDVDMDDADEQENEVNLEDEDDLDLDDLDLEDLDMEENNADARAAEAAEAEKKDDDDDVDLDVDLEEDDNLDLADAGDDATKASDVKTDVTHMKAASPNADLEGAMSSSTAAPSKGDGAGAAASSGAAAAAPVVPKLGLGALPKPETTRTDDDDKPLDNVVTLRIDSHLLMNNKFLKEPFKVVKIDESALVGGRKERIWEIDFFGHCFNNLDSNGYKSFTLAGPKLFRVERHLTDPKRLTVYFFEAAHPYDLQFTSVERRNRFFELSMLQRRASVLWCPSLCPDGENDARIQINGTNIKRHSGKVNKVQGKGSFMIARMPYEIHEVWFGVINLRQQPLPANPSVLNPMMPRGSEVYVIGMLETPPELLGQKTIGEWLLAHLGANSYYVLAQSVMESKPKSCNSNTVILTIVRRPFIIHLSNIEGVELDSVVQDGNGSPTGYTMAACTMRIHESLCAFVVVQAVGTAKLSDAQRASHFRLALSNLALGNEKLDFGTRFDYTFIGGALGFPKPFAQAEDALLAQMSAGNMLSDFKEGTPAAELKNSQFPMRVFYKSRVGSCRADIKSYGSVPSLPFGNNAFATMDLFTVRTFLSSFGETPKGPISVALKDIIIVPERIPAFGDAEMHITGSWFENPAPIPIERTGEHYSIKNTSVPILRPATFHKEFVRLAHIDFAIFGVLDAARERKKGSAPGKKVMLACGSLTLKNNSAIGEEKDFTVPLVFRACTVGSIIATMGLPIEHAVPDQAAGASSPTSGKDVLE